MVRINKNWNEFRQVSLWKLRPDLYTVTVRRPLGNAWYPFECSESEAIYHFNRITDCLTEGIDFVTLKDRSIDGEQVITDPSTIETLTQ